MFTQEQYTICDMPIKPDKIVYVFHLGGSSALIAMRFFVGFGEGTMFPALSALLAMWVPLSERSIMGTLVFGGAQVNRIK